MPSRDPWTLLSNSDLQLSAALELGIVAAARDYLKDLPPRKSRLACSKLSQSPDLPPVDLVKLLCCRVSLVAMIVKKTLNTTWAVSTSGPWLCVPIVSPPLPVPLPFCQALYSQPVHASPQTSQCISWVPCC